MFKIPAQVGTGDSKEILIGLLKKVTAKEVDIPDTADLHHFRYSTDKDRYVFLVTNNLHNQDPKQLGKRARIGYVVDVTKNLIYYFNYSDETDLADLVTNIPTRPNKILGTSDLDEMTFLKAHVQSLIQLRDRNLKEEFNSMSYSQITRYCTRKLGISIHDSEELRQCLYLIKSLCNDDHPDYDTLEQISFKDFQDDVLCEDESGLVESELVGVFWGCPELKFTIQFKKHDVEFI